MHKFKIVLIGCESLVANSIKKIVFTRQYEDLNFKNDYKWIFTDKTIIDLANYNDIYDYFYNMNTENLIVINCAVYRPKGKNNEEEIMHCFENNLNMDINLHAVCIKLRIKKVINLMPLDVKYKLFNEKISSCYHSYLNAKTVSRFYRQTINSCSEKYKYVDLLLPNLFGEYGLNKNINICDLLFDLCKNNNDENIIYGNSNQIINITYVDNIANIILDFICLFDVSGEYILTCGDNNITLKDFFKIIEEKLPTKIKFSENKNEKILDTDINKYEKNNTKLKELYNTKNKTLDFKIPIKDGLNKTIDWIKNNINYIDSI